MVGQVKDPLDLELEGLDQFWFQLVGLQKLYKQFMSTDTTLGLTFGSRINCHPLTFLTLIIVKPFLLN